MSIEDHEDRIDELECELADARRLLVKYDRLMDRVNPFDTLSKGDAVRWEADLQYLRTETTAKEAFHSEADWPQSRCKTPRPTGPTQRGAQQELFG